MSRITYSFRDIRKNQRTLKLEEEKNVQRITGPIINIIKKNYIKANNNINA